tara:strand:+ start:1527 stop:1664 length:138 start_codon:yes stop_codon:yes gene_type:complete
LKKYNTLKFHPSMIGGKKWWNSLSQKPPEQLGMIKTCYSSMVGGF